MRDIVHDRVQEVRDYAATTALLGRWMILGSLAGGTLLLIGITFIAVQIAQRITAAFAL